MSSAEPGKRRIRASAVCVYRAHLLCVRLRDPLTRVDRLFVPGGAVEPEETPAAAAARETFEETGYRVEIAPESELSMRYDYVWNGILFDVTTHFFRATLHEPGTVAETPHEPAYNEGVHWLALGDLDRELGFHAGMLSAIKRLL